MTYNNLNDNSYFESTAIRYNKEKDEKRGLRRLGNITGIALLLFVILQFAVLMLLVITHLANVYANDNNLTYALGTIISIVTLGGAFLIAWLFLRDDKKICLNFGKPYDKFLMLSAVPIGMLICLGANFITFYISELFKTSFGIVFESPEMIMPSTPLGVVSFILQVAFVPALVEEFAVRGVVMMPLRKYGDAFAIVTSAVIFGVMHGNLVQAPFAFIVGIGIGYLVIVTGSMWTGVLIHFINNLFSASISLLYEFIPDDYVNIIYYAALACFLILGISSIILFKDRAREKQISLSLVKPKTELSGTSKFGVFMLNIPMVLALIYLIYTTSKYISFT